MSKSHRYPSYVINAAGPKPEPRRTEAQKEALRKRQQMINKIDDMEFAKSLGIFDLCYGDKK